MVCKQTGFEPYILRKEKMVLFNRKITFHEISNELMEDYREMMGESRKPADATPVEEKK